MKLFLAIFLTCLVSYSYSVSSVDEVCQWTAKRNDLIKQLSPYGQAVITRILKDLQYISGAALQPIYDYVQKTNNESINALLNSTDANKFNTLVSYYGVGNWTSGAGNLRDDCQDAKNVEAIVRTFAPANQLIVVSLITQVHETFDKVFPVIVAINRLLDYRLYDQLSGENQTVLAAIANLYLN